MNRILYILIVFAFVLPPVLLGAEEETNGMPANFLEAPNSKFRNDMNDLLNKKVSVNFDNAHVREVIQYLSFVADLSIVLDETPFEYENKSTAAEAPYESTDNKVLTEFSEKVKKSKFIITIHLNDIAVKNVLWYICQKSDLMAFFDEDIAENIPGPIVFTSKDNADKILKERIVKKRRKRNFQRALNTFQQKWK